MLAVVWDSPLLWAVVIAWILSVTLHEFAHGIVAYFGGDYTIRERGGLTLNPLQYIDPIMSIVLPLVLLLMGGIPLPGGVTYVRTDLLRSRAWDTAVSLAGPAMNFLIFLLCVIPLHPSVGWVDPHDPGGWTDAQMFVGAMCVLQFLSVIFNLVPVPPLDGFRAIAPYLKNETRLMLSTPPTSTVLFIAYFFLILQIPQFQAAVGRLLVGTLLRLGLDRFTIDGVGYAFETVFRR